MGVELTTPGSMYVVYRLYETLDRILEQYERLTSEKTELDEEEKEDLK